METVNYKVFWYYIIGAFSPQNLVAGGGEETKRKIVGGRIWSQMQELGGEFHSPPPHAGGTMLLAHNSHARRGGCEMTLALALALALAFALSLSLSLALAK